MIIPQFDFLSERQIQKALDYAYSFLKVTSSLIILLIIWGCFLSLIFLILTDMKVLIIDRLNKGLGEPFEEGTYGLAGFITSCGNCGNCSYSGMVFE